MSDESAVFHLIAKLPGGDEVTVPLRPGAPIVIGRALDCPLTLTGDGRASRHHAAVELRGSEVWVRDLESRNGVTVNGTRIAVESLLQLDDDLRLGSSVLRLEAAGNAPELAAITVCSRCSRTLTAATEPGGDAPLCRHCTRADKFGAPHLPGFTVERRLGSGAMGHVWLAKDARGERVALKILAPQQGATPVAGALARFVREANALRALCHPGIVLLLEAGESENLHYIVMEYVEGQDYDQRLESEGRIPLNEVCRLVLAVADALGHAHDNGIVHRDIKPSNIMRSATEAPAGAAGQIKITDFGLARLAQKTGLSVQSMSSAGIGSPLYIPPEQVLAIEKADHRSDLYALGATAFHLAAGRAVFEAASVAEIITKVLDEPPPAIDAVLDDVPAPIAQALAWALEKDPERRYQSAGEMIQAFKSAMKSAGIAG